MGHLIQSLVNSWRSWRSDAFGTRGAERGMKRLLRNSAFRIRLIQSLANSWRSWRSPPLGWAGERAAARFLRRRGFTIVARGARDRLGEIDLVAVERRTVVFVEVKTRRSRRAGAPVEAVGPDKQRRLTRAALSFLRRHDLLEAPARFDVVGVVWPRGRRPVIKHYGNAFEPTGRWQMRS